MTETLWGTTPAGVLFSQGTLDKTLTKEKRTFLSLKERVCELEALYGRSGVRVSPKSGLAKMIAGAKLLSDRSLLNERGYTELDVLRAVHVNRITDAVLTLNAIANRKHYLSKLTRGSLDFFARGRSQAKDVFWEIEFWTMLRRRGGDAELLDPPDITLKLPSGVLAIACKKICSERNVEKVLSRACEQVEGYDAGAVAVNIDDLVPAESVVAARDQSDLDRILQPICDNFANRHSRHLYKYLSTGRMICAVIAVQAAADVLSWRPRFNNALSALFWGVKGLPNDKERFTREFRALVMGRR